MTRIGDLTMSLLLAMLLCQALVAKPAASQVEGQSKVVDVADATEVPPSPVEYMGREIARTMSFRHAPWLLRKSRERQEECSKLLASLDVKPGATVCDLGCGNGFYTLQLAKLVGPQGVVWAVDIQPEMLELLEERAKTRGVPNLKPTLGSILSPNLPADSIDLLLLVDVYHEFSHPEQMLFEIRKSLKPGGRVALVEFREEDPEVPINPLHKMSQKQVVKEYEGNGFQLVGQYDELPWQHVFFFARDDSSLKAIQLKPWKKTEDKAIPSDETP